MANRNAPREQAITAFAPGRVNLLGEHTDYNFGLVLPTTIPQRCEVKLQFREDARVMARSANLMQPDDPPLCYELGSEQRGRGWIDYVQGVTWALAVRGVKLCGFDVAIRSQVPAGSGLSSSAALLVALLRALRDGLDLELPDLELARLAQHVENQFVGAPVGILDPLACSLCERGQALFVDTQNLASESLPLPGEIELVVIHSGVSHRHAQRGEHDAPHGDYRQRRAECEQAAKLLGVASLRELDADDVAQSRAMKLDAPYAARVRHVLQENQRVRQAAGILRSGAHEEADLRALGELFAASHRSQRDDYAVSVAAVDQLVAIGAADPGIIPGAARLTGGGFGGSVVMLGRRGSAQAAARRIAARYAAQSGNTPTVLVPEVREG